MWKLFPAMVNIENQSNPRKLISATITSGNSCKIYISVHINLSNKYYEILCNLSAGACNQNSFPFRGNYQFIISKLCTESINLCLYARYVEGSPRLPSPTRDFSGERWIRKCKKSTPSIFQNMNHEFYIQSALLDDCSTFQLFAKYIRYASIFLSRIKFSTA